MKNTKRAIENSKTKHVVKNRHLLLDRKANVFESAILSFLQ
ncbi:hypothetical protein BLGI_2503 [Brevibacillus laterosporus GI-9]|nr:hypothetical protein BLGI_2503 [Brevibacillus laterosporus GI-9]